jgi:hypothetical protein
MFRQILSRIRLPHNSRDLLHDANLRHGTDGFTSPPKEGVLRIFSPLKIRRLQPGLNPRTWVPKASTLPLDHQGRYCLVYAQHILNSHHEYGTINEIRTLLKLIEKTWMLITFEQFFIQSHHQRGQLITEQNPGDQNPIYQLYHDSQVTWRHHVINTTFTKHVSSNTPMIPAGSDIRYVYRV